MTDRRAARPSDDTFTMPSMRLDDRVAVVTGGSRGLGRGMAMALATAGADLALVGRDQTTLEPAVRQAEALGRRAAAVEADVAAPDAAARIVEATVETLGRIDIVVHAAGINVRQPADAFSREDFRRVQATNVEAAYFLSQAAARVMRGQTGGGRIIAVTSVSTFFAVPNVSAYAISKGGLHQMVRSLALEWAKDGITVNAVAPGRFWTAMTDAVFSDPERHAGAVAVIPLGRPGLPADLAGVTVLLASEAGAYITGQTIYVDGGWTATSGVRA